MSAAPVPVRPVADLAIGPQPADPAEHLAKLAATLREEQRRGLGFPGNFAFDLESCAPLLNVFANNLGDPEAGGACDLGAYERAVLEYFTHIAGAAPDATYGSVASSSSQALLHCLYTARRVLPRAHVYASDQAHDSVKRACDLLRMELVTIPSLPDGTMDPEALRVQAVMRRRTRPYRKEPGAVVVATCGSTMRGAVDDIRVLRAAASAAGPVHVHVDAAGGGLIAAYSDPAPNWSFTAAADSLNISGHKLVGLPVPTGISLIRRDLVAAADGEYLAATDHTIACSGGLASLLLWARLQSLGHTGMAALVRRCQDVAAYAVDRLEEAGARPGRFPGSLTVTLDRPPAWLARRYHLACEGSIAHIVTTGHVTRAAIDALADDLATVRRAAQAGPTTAVPITQVAS